MLDLLATYLAEVQGALLYTRECVQKEASPIDVRSLNTVVESVNTMVDTAYRIAPTIWPPGREGGAEKLKLRSQIEE